MSKKLAICILTILYTVGLLGIGLELYPPIVWLTPINLLVSIVVAMYFDTAELKRLLIFSIIVFCIGYGIEVAGIQTGKIFGEYQYGAILGPKIWETPLMIGTNWVLVTYSTGYTINAVLPKISKLFKAFIGATILVVLDTTIEPVAIRWGMWTWAIEEVPLQNYLAWWIIGLIMMGIFSFTFEQRTNKVAVAVLILQFIFFGLLNL